ncbi:MAG: hypothetical protein B0D91_06885 [Oceanospirillales bacterium LUC14_002_19_P2]|nr:MAG: hypothetical protein B0D91_06885 [Oceanospirillales bacterium LUC14_002_19_P2]
MTSSRFFSSRFFLVAVGGVVDQLGGDTEQAGNQGIGQEVDRPIQRREGPIPNVISAGGGNECDGACGPGQHQEGDTPGFFMRRCADFVEQPLSTGFHGQCVC